MTAILDTDLTTLAVDGTGIYDKLMQSVKMHLQEEFNANRIRGADYAQVYVSSINVAMQQGIAFLLAKQRADKEAELLAQQILNAVKEGAILDQKLLNLQSEKALTDAQKLKVDAEELLVDQQAAKVSAEKLLVDSQKALTDAEALNVPKTGLKIDAETGLINQKKTNEVTANTNLVKQQNKLDAEVALLGQKKLTEEAQIVDRVTGAVADVTGVIGKQKGLYQAQADGFTRDAEHKMAKLAGELWSVRRTTDPNNTPGVVASKTDDGSIGSIIAKAMAGIGVV